MYTDVGRARVGRWYRNLATNEVFQVTGVDDAARTIAVRTRDGCLEVIEADTWKFLPLGLATPPQERVNPAEDPEPDQSGFTVRELEMRSSTYCPRRTRQ